MTRTVVLWWATASSSRSSVPAAAEVGAHPRDADVPLQDRRVDEARAVADLVAVVVERSSTRRAAGARTWAGTGRRRGRAGPSPPSRRRCRWSPTATYRRAARAGSPRSPTNRRDPSRTPRSIQPKPSSLGVTLSASLNASRASCHSMSISASPASMRSVISASSPNGRMPWPRPGLEDGVEHVDRAVLGHGQLEAEVAGVAGPGQRHRGVGHLRRHVVEVAERLGLRHQGASARRATAAPGRRASRSPRSRPRARPAGRSRAPGTTTAPAARRSAGTRRPSAGTPRRRASRSPGRRTRHVYCAWPGRHVLMSRTSAPASSRSASGPVTTYL